MNARLTFVQALSSLHPGTGQGAGVIDLPIAREVATGLPYFPGSSLKGVLRDQCDEPQRSRLFGPDTASISDANAHAGAALFSDQRLLLFPVRSLSGTFAWVTSPFVLQRFRRDCENIGVTPAPPDTKMPMADINTAWVRRGSALPVRVNADLDVVMLEDLDLTAKRVAPAREWADWLKKKLFLKDVDWQELFAARFCIVHDDVLSFLLDTATEITARNQLNENKTSANLWYEEALPAETILHGIVVGQQVGKSGLAPHDVLDAVAGLTAVPLRLGGNTSVGRGLCRITIGG
jgi:CRISPR-associated protein Cmr4